MRGKRLLGKKVKGTQVEEFSVVTTLNIEL